MTKYIDFKQKIWVRMHFSDETDMNKIIEKLEEGYLPCDLCDQELGFTEFESMLDTEEYITPSENGGMSTIEVYEDNDSTIFQECIWDNVNKSRTQRVQIN